MRAPSEDINFSPLRRRRRRRRRRLSRVATCASARDAKGVIKSYTTEWKVTVKRRGAENGFMACQILRASVSVSARAELAAD